MPAQTAWNKTQRVLQACLGFAERKRANLQGNGSQAADGLVCVLWKLLALSAGRVQAGLLGSCLPSAACPMQAVSSPLSGHGLEPLTLNCSMLGAAAALLELSEDWRCRKGPQYCPRGRSCLDLISRRFLSARRCTRRWGQVTGGGTLPCTSCWSQPPQSLHPALCSGCCPASGMGQMENANVPGSNPPPDMLLGSGEVDGPTDTLQQEPRLMLS